MEFSTLSFDTHCRNAKKNMTAEGPANVMSHISRIWRVATICLVFSVGICETTQATDLFGRVSLRWYRMLNAGAPTPQTFGGYARLQLTDLFIPGLGFSVYMRQYRRPTNPLASSPRIYELQLSGTKLFGLLDLNVGRLNSPYLGSFGLLDGIAATATPVQHFFLGTFAGWRHDYVTLSSDRAYERRGVFVGATTRHLDSQISWIEESQENVTQRRFISLRNSFDLKGKFFLYQLGEVDFQSALTGQTEKPSLTYLSTDLRYWPNRMFRASLGYTYRTEYFNVWGDSLLADSVYAASVRESWDTGFTLRPFKHWRLSAGYRYGFRREDNETQTYWYVGLANSRFFGKYWYANVRYSQSRSPYSVSRSLYASLDFSLTRRVRLTLTDLWNRYEGLATSYSYDSQVQGLSLNFLLSRRIRLYLHADRYTGPYQDDRMLYVEVSYRFLRDWRKR